MENSEEKATSAGILNSVASLSGMIGPFMGGLIAEIYGYRATMYFAVVITIVAYIIFRIAARYTK